MLLYYIKNFFIDIWKNGVSLKFIVNKYVDVIYVMWFCKE